MRAERAPAAGASPLDFLPARWLPLLYLGFAHLCLAAAFAAVALDPRGTGGFYDHPRLVAVVHLVTLGWISGSILGSLYLVAPLAFRTALPSGPPDRAAFACFAVGVVGMVGHLWIERLSGMVWSARREQARPPRAGGSDHVVRGEGVTWLRRYLGEGVDREVRHPLIASAFDCRTIGVRFGDGRRADGGHGASVGRVSHLSGTEKWSKDWGLPHLTPASLDLCSPVALPVACHRSIDPGGISAQDHCSASMSPPP